MPGSEETTLSDAEDHDGHDHAGHDHSGHGHGSGPHTPLNSTEAADPETGAAEGADDDGPKVPLSQDSAREALKAVVDPELGINIVDLGLVYEVAVDGGDVQVQYSLTTMGCPIGPLIEAQMQEALTKLEGFATVTPELVFRPAWTPEMMTDEAKAALGFF